MDFAKFSRINKERAMIWHKGDIGNWSMGDWALAVAGEVGEICNIIKKYNRFRDGLPSNNPKGFSFDDLADEIADTVIYCDLLATRCGFDLEQIIIHKFNKISDREGLPQRL